MNWRIEERRWIPEIEYKRYTTDGKHQVTVINSSQNMGVNYYYAQIVSYHDYSYEQVVTHLLRKKYNLDSELAILRQRDTKPEEFKAYNACAEECKAIAKAMIKEREDFYASIVNPEIEAILAEAEGSEL